MIDWSKGYTAQYNAAIIDPQTWRDIDTIEITGGTIKKDASGLKQSASINCTDWPEGIELWIRVYLIASQNGETTRTAIFTGLATTPTRTIEGTLTTHGITCYSVLKAVDDIDLLPGWYAGQGANAGEVLKDLLSATPAPYAIEENAPFLTDYIVAEQNETRLTMVNKIISTIGWGIDIDGTGRIIAGPQKVNSNISFGPEGMDMIEDESIKITQDTFSCPNVYAVTSGDNTYILKDDSLDSPYSIQNRGREVWTHETGVVMPSNENIKQYTERKLAEAQAQSMTAEYKRRYYPELNPGEIIGLRYPGKDLNGQFRIISQSIALGHAATVSEKIERAEV